MQRSKIRETNYLRRLFAQATLGESREFPDRYFSIWIS
jgi:hypothetical protein